MTMTRHSRRWLAPLGLALALAGCASDLAYREGLGLMDEGRYEEGLARLDAAVAASPAEPRFRAALALQKDRALATLLAQAEQSRQAGDYAGATDLYQRVLGLAPRNPRALEGLRVLEQRRLLGDMERQAQAAFTRGDLEQAEKQLAALLALDPRYPQALALRKEIEGQRARIASPYPQLRTRFARPVTLEFRDAGLKMILDVLSRTTGINFIVDKDVKPDLKATLFVRQVALEDALNLLLTQSQLEKKVISDNTVLVYANTPPKQKEYQDWAIRTFFVTNMDVKQAQSLVKTILKTKDVVIDEKLNILTMRDTAEAIRLAEKLLQAQDQPEPEVMLEVELLDVSRDRILDLGIQWPSTFSVLSPSGEAVKVLSDLRGPRRESRIAIDRTVQLRAQARDSDVNTLASPRIRVRNKEKAKIHIGDRIPIVNATATPSTQGPVISESVQYLDTGIKLEVEPVVYQNDEVSIKVALEVSDSQDAGRTNNGTSLVRVKTSNAATVLRLKDGETQILAGLIRKDHSAGSDKIPGLGDVPLAGRLFGQNEDNWQKRELVLSITPRIVRNLPYVAPHLLEYPSGTEGSLQSRPLSVQSITSQPSVPLSVPPFDNLAGKAPASTALAAAPLAIPTVTAPAATVLNLEGSQEIKVGQESTLTLRVKADQPLVSTALQIDYDPKAVKVLAVAEGDLMRQDGTQTRFSTRMDEAAGRVFVGLSRSGGSGATGEGTLVTLRVAGVAPAAATPVQVVVFSGMGPGNNLHATPLPAPLAVAVVP
ncbi:MAG: secretion type protein [Rhodocyclaceae bacterium]|nr:secretion type protein [Rhodocyclaceae bacterium]